MASKRQIAANKANAKRSTGPRTAAGKMRSRRNSLTHGLTCKTVAVLFDEDPDEFEALRQSLLDDYRPKTTLGREIVNELTYVTWQLARHRRMENDVLHLTLTKHVWDTNRHFIKVLGQSGSDVSHLEETGLALMNEHTMRAAQTSAVTHSVFDSATLPDLERHRTSLQRNRERLLEQLAKAERMRARPEDPDQTNPSVTEEPG